MPPATRAELERLMPHGGAVCLLDSVESRNEAFGEGPATVTLAAAP
jgi:predicted hotdog family 3-hydroxylacyl-ACP dehydratase